MSTQRYFDNTPLQGMDASRAYSNSDWAGIRLNGFRQFIYHLIQPRISIICVLFANGIRAWCARTSRIDRFPDKVVEVDAVHDAIELISIEQHRGTKRNRKSRCRARNRANAATPNLLAVISRNCFPERCSLLAPATVFLPVPLAASSSSFSSSMLH